MKNCILLMPIALIMLTGCKAASPPTFRIIVPKGFLGHALVVTDPNWKYVPGKTYLLRVENKKVYMPEGFLVREGPGNLPIPDHHITEVLDDTGKHLSNGHRANRGEISANLLQSGAGDELAKTGFDVNCYVRVFKVP